MNWSTRGLIALWVAAAVLDLIAQKWWVATLCLLIAGLTWVVGMQEQQIKYLSSRLLEARSRR